MDGDISLYACGMYVSNPGGASIIAQIHQEQKREDKMI